MSLATLEQFDAWAVMTGATLPANVTARQTALDKATVDIRDHCGRSFTYSPADAGADEARTFVGNAEPTLDLDDCLSVGSVALDGSSLDDTSYRADAVGASPYIYLVRVRNNSSLYLDETPVVYYLGTWPVDSVITVTGQWGYAAAVPDAVVEACCMLAALRMLGGDGWNALNVKTTAILSVSVTYDLAMAKEKRAEALGLLRKYKRISPEPNL